VWLIHFPPLQWGIERDHQKHDTGEPGAAVAYRRIHGRSLMALTKLRGAIPSIDELCRISSVQTLPDTLWVTARFLDGATRSFRPENIRPATKDEACASEEIAAATNAA
jgi:hypothetical protein